MTINTNGEKIKIFLNSTELTQDSTPAPDSPVEVNVITGENTITISNSDGTEEQNYPISLSSKNLLNFTLTDSVTKNGITFTKNNDGSLTLNGTATTTFSQVFNITHQVLNGTYTIKHNVLGGTTSASSYMSIQKSPSGNISDRVYGGTTSSTFNITADTTIITASLYITSGTTFTDYNVGSQLQIGSTATDYTSYFNPIEYCKIGDYADQIFKNTTDSTYYDNTLTENEWYLKKNINKVVLNGSENWQQFQTNVYVPNIFPTGISDDLVINGYCDKCLTNTNTNIGYNGNARTGLLIYNLVSFWGLEDTTPTTWKTYLANNNLTLYYPLAIPNYIHISQTDYPTLKGQLDNLYNNAITYEGTTNITQTNADLSFDITYELISNTEGKIRDVVYDINEFLRVNL